VPLAASAALDKPLLSSKQDKFKLAAKPKTALTLNHDGHSYFVAKYDNPEHVNTLIKAISDQKLSPIDRLLFVQNGLLLEKAGRTMTVDNIKLLAAYSQERDEAVWGLLAGIVGNARTLIDRDEVLEAKLNAFIRPLAAPLVKELGWHAGPNDSSQTLKLRGLALSMAAAAQDPSVIKEGLQLFKDFKLPADLAADIRSVVYFIAVRHGTDDDFERLLKLYGSLQSAEDKDEVASELTVARQPDKINRLLKMITSDKVRLQDAPTWFAWLMRNRYATDAAWQWLQDNWSWVEKNYGSDKSYDRFPRYSAMVFSKPQQLKSYKNFFEPKSSLALERPIKLGVEEIEGRIEWRQKNEQPVKDWLANLG
jgi:aminopeptidase N